jgi:hypothetical protein
MWESRTQALVLLAAGSAGEPRNRSHRVRRARRAVHVFGHIEGVVGSRESHVMRPARLALAMILGAIAAAGGVERPNA